MGRERERDHRCIFSLVLLLDLYLWKSHLSLLSLRLLICKVGMKNPPYLVELCGGFSNLFSSKYCFEHNRKKIPAPLELVWS